MLLTCVAVEMMIVVQLMMSHDAMAPQHALSSITHTLYTSSICTGVLHIPALVLISSFGVACLLSNSRTL